MTEIDTCWSDVHKRRMPLHKPKLVEKAIKTANWQDDRARQVFLSTPLEYDATEVRSGQRIWFCNALSALTREEVLTLYDHLIAGAIAGHETGGDFTSPDVRARLPHIYGDVG